MSGLRRRNNSEKVPHLSGLEVAPSSTTPRSCWTRVSIKRGVTTPRTDGRPREGSSSITSSSGCLATKSTGVIGETVGLGEREGDPERGLCVRRPREGVGEVKSADSL